MSGDLEQENFSPFTFEQIHGARDKVFLFSAEGLNRWEFVSSLD